MKKYFVTSDIHGFFTIFKSALDRAGFDINNKDHVLIICGDLFDRGKEPVELYYWIKALPKSRRILVRGNHEHLLLDLIDNQGVWKYYDIGNGTYDTWCAFNKAGLLKDVKKWINSKAWVNYYELKKYIFVHSFIPTSITNQSTGEWKESDPDWRINATDKDWVEATWGCPYQQFSSGLFNEEINKGKTLVCGHWHTSDFFNYFGEKEHGRRNNPIYLSKNLIALDACTALTKGINILVIEGKKITTYNYNDKELGV